MFLSNGELFGEVIKGIKGAAGIKFLVVLPVATLYLAVVSGRERADLLVPDAQLGKRFLKQRQRFLSAVAHLVGKLKSVVGLDSLNGIGEFLHDVLQEHGR